MGAVNVRTVERRDRRAFCRLLDEFKPRIAGLRSPLTYRAVFSDAFTSPHIVIVVATDGDELVGFSVAAIDWNRYQRRFPFRHPLAAMASLAKRLVDRLRVALRRSGGAPGDGGDGDPIGSAAGGAIARSWRESSPDIAKVIYTGVARGTRHRGVAYAMAVHRMRLLGERGVRRIDAIVWANNTAAIRLNERLGYRAERHGDVYFMSRSLVPPP